MANDEERLIVALEARVTDFEKRMQQAERRGTRTYQQLAAGSSRATKQMETDMVRSTTRVNQALATGATQIGKFGAAFAGGLVVGGAVAALEGIRQAVAESTKSVLELADQAKIAGLSFKSFQELKFVADQNRISIDQLTDGLKEMNLRADEFVQTGSGSGAEAFQRLGYNAETLAAKMKEPNELFLEIIGRLKKLDQAAQIRIADEVFGGSGGEVFVKLIEEGEAGIRAQIQAANDLGIVMDDQMIRKAEEVNQKFNLIATTIGTHIKSAIVDAVGAWFEFIDSYRDFKNQQNNTLENRQAELGLKRVELENQLLQLGDGRDRLSVRKRSVIELELSKIAAEERQIVEELARRVDALNANTKTKDWVPPTPPTGGFGAVKTGGGKADLMQFLAPGKDASHISGLNSGFESKLEKMLGDLPKELAGQITINSGFRSNERQAQLWADALQKYGSVAEARRWVAPPGKSQHNQGEAADLGYKSDAARQWAHDNASKYGLSFPLSNENWHIEDAGARGKMLAEKTRGLEQQGEAYDKIVQQAKEFIAGQGLEAAALGLTQQQAARLRYEQELLNAAQDAGLKLTPDQLAYYKQLAARMAEAEERTRGLTKSQEEARAAAEQFASVSKDVAKGFITDMMNGTSAADALKNALARIGDTLLNSALDSLFKTPNAAGSGGGLFGNLISSIFSGIGKNAAGTDNWRGGLTMVGEKGPELINLQRHAQVIPNHRLGQLGGSSSTFSPTYQIDARGSQMSEADFRRVLDERDRKMMRDVRGKVSSWVQDDHDRRF